MAHYLATDKLAYKKANIKIDGGITGHPLQSHFRSKHD
jgi:hypothetical protein